MKHFDGKIVTLSSGISEVAIPTKTTIRKINSLSDYFGIVAMLYALVNDFRNTQKERCVFINVCKSVKMKFEAIMYNK